MKEHKGFTLVELLAVIVILAILLIIAIPSVLNTTDRAKKALFEEKINKIVKTYNEEFAINEMDAILDKDICTMVPMNSVDPSTDLNGIFLFDPYTNETYVTAKDSDFFIDVFNVNGNEKMSNKIEPATNSSRISFDRFCRTVGNLDGNECHFCYSFRGDMMNVHFGRVGVPILIDGININRAIRYITGTEQVSWNDNDYFINASVDSNSQMVPSRVKAIKNIKKVKYRKLNQGEYESQGYSSRGYEVTLPGEYHAPTDGTLDNRVAILVEGDTLYFASEQEYIYLNPMSQFIFYGLTDVEEIDVSHFKTDLVSELYGTFVFCEKLTKIDGLETWNVSNVQNMDRLFLACSSLSEINVGGWDTASLVDMDYMFASCHSLVRLDVAMWNVSHVIQMGGLFNFCDKLQYVNMTYWETSALENVVGMFQNCYALRVIDVTYMDVSGVKTMQYMFCGDLNLEEVYVGGWNTKSCEDMSYMFLGCTKLKFIDLTQFDTSKAKTFRMMFYGCSSVETLDVSKFDTSNVTDMSWMFADCDSLVNIDTSNFDMSKVTDVYRMFSGVRVRKIAFKPNLNPNLVADTFITRCPNIEEIDMRFLKKPINEYGLHTLPNLQTVYVSNDYEGSLTYTMKIFKTDANFKLVYETDANGTSYTRQIGTKKITFTRA